MFTETPDNPWDSVTFSEPIVARPCIWLQRAIPRRHQRRVMRVLHKTFARLRLCSPAVYRFSRSRLRPIVSSVAVVATAGVLSLSFPAVVAQAGDPSTPLMDVHQLKSGDKGYGLTVFSGTEPERFEVEVVGVLTNFLPHQDLVLVKTSHPRLQVAKVVAGMSGSPVYVGGKMIGAYAYGWQFGEESVAGVTPIRSMLDELHRHIPREALQPLPLSTASPVGDTRRVSVRSGRSGTARPSSSALTAEGTDADAFARYLSGHRYRGDVASYSVEEHSRQVAAALPTASVADSAMRAVPIATPISVGGLTSKSLAWLHQQLAPVGLEPMQAGGSGKPDASAPARYVDGGAIGVELIRGDISAAGIGTVTRVQGNRVLAFGHPMNGSGISRLPTAIARIHWILASKARSFKIGAPVRSLGSLVNDRQAAIVVDTNVQAPFIPLDVEIRGAQGAPHPRWSMQVAHDRWLSPSFAAVAIAEAIDSTASERRDTSWRATTTISVRNYGQLVMHDAGVNVTGGGVASDFHRGDAMRALGALLNNPWEPVHIEGIRTKVDVVYKRDLLQLRGAVALTPEIDPGQKAKIRLQLVGYEGQTQFRTFEVDIPKELAGSTVQVEIYPGHTETRPSAPLENLADLLAVLPQQTYAPDVLIASAKVGGQGVAHRQNVATRLPPGAVDTLRSAATIDPPEPIASLVRTEIPVGSIVVGNTSVHIGVRRSPRR